jgi:two-component system, NtrC family, sensor kinase
MKFISEFKHFSSFKKLFPLLSIIKKIVFGYTLSLGIIILGTSGGLLVSDIYFQTANQFEYLPFYFVVLLIIR